MEPTHITLLHVRTHSLRMRFPLHARAQRRHPPSAPSVRAPGLHYHFTYTEVVASSGLKAPDNDSMIVVEALHEIHRSRQAMLNVLAQLRGDDTTEQVW